MQNYEMRIFRILYSIGGPILFAVLAACNGDGSSSNSPNGNSSPNGQQPIVHGSSLNVTGKVYKAGENGSFGRGSYGNFR